MLENKKIIFSIVSLGKGGAERVVSILANNLSLKNDVTIITLVNEKIAYKLNDNIKVIELAENSKNKNNVFKKILFISNFIKRYKKLKKSFDNVNPDVIISFLPEMTFMSIMANKGKYKMILSDRNDPKREYTSLIYKSLMKHLFPKVDGYVFQTDDAKEYFDNIIDFQKKKSQIIVNPVNPKFIKERYNGIREKEIVAVGRLNEQKNYDLMINSFNNIKDKYPDYVLKIYGEGPLKEKLTSKIQQMNLENKVLLQGVSDSIDEKIYKSDLFIMSSDYEGIPNALIEAMCLGLPVISTDCPCGGPKMFISNNENGLLVPVNNEKELSNAIDNILADDLLRNKIGTNASKISDKIKPDIIVEQWSEFISSVIGDGKNEKNN